MMAETSVELADLSVLTAEDPRTESLDGILEEMAAGARSKGGREGETFWRVARSRRSHQVCHSPCKGRGYCPVMRKRT